MATEVPIVNAYYLLFCDPKAVALNFHSAPPLAGQVLQGRSAKWTIFTVAVKTKKYYLKNINHFIYHYAAMFNKIIFFSYKHTFYNINNL